MSATNNGREAAKSTQKLKNISAPEIVATVAGVSEKLQLADVQTQMRIMVVDDCLPLRKMMSKMLTSNGFDVVEAASGQEAIRTLGRMTEALPSLFIIDLNMPEISGQDLMRYLQSQPNLKNIPMLACSSETSLDIINNLRALGIKGYILKPFKTQTVMEKIRQVLNLPAE